MTIALTVQFKIHKHTRNIKTKHPSVHAYERAHISYSIFLIAFDSVERAEIKENLKTTNRLIKSGQLLQKSENRITNCPNPIR